MFSEYYTNFNRIEVDPVDEYYIGRGFAPDVDPVTPPALWLMMPIKQGAEDITKALRLLMYQYENYWGIYSVGAISRAPREVSIRECVYDRVLVKGRTADESARYVLQYLAQRQFHTTESLLKAIYACGNSKYTTFASHVNKPMAERSITKAWYAARLMTNAGRNFEIAEKLDARIADIYWKCRTVAEDDGVILQSCRNTKEGEISHGYSN